MYRYYQERLYTAEQPHSFSSLIIPTHELTHSLPYLVQLTCCLSACDLQGGWLSSRRKSSEPVWTHTLHFWCLNPAVVFGVIGEAAHSVIVASGTLSPLGSFQSELGVPFPINLEASHVIKADQVRKVKADQVRSRWTTDQAGSRSRSIR